MRIFFGALVRIQILFWISSAIGFNFGLKYYNESSRIRVKRDEVQVSREKSDKPDLKCVLPGKVKDKTYTVICRDEKRCGKNAGDEVPELTTLFLKCNRGFSFDRTPSMVHCVNTTWIPSIGKCKKICKKLEPENVEIKCYRYRKSSIAPCSGDFLAGMVVTIQCMPYHHVEVPVLHNEITCQNNGDWSKPLYKCIPDCGKALASPTKLISNGTADNYGASPWNVAIYDVYDRKKPSQICSGTIISPYLIVSAAHCFFDDDNRKLFSSKRYEIAVGKIKRNYAIKDNSETAFYKINEIILSDKGYTGGPNYAADIAILRTEKKININLAVLPACLQLDNTQTFNPGEREPGKLVGWGLDSKETPSDILLTANLPFISRSECLNIVHVDFRNSISLDKFCAGSVNNSGPGAKQGDSGGGLMYRDAQSGLYFLRGIVSNKDPSTSTSIAVFTDVSFYVNWISTTINEVANSKKKES